MDVPEDTLVVYSDYVCPFCFLGKASLEAYLDAADEPPSLQWRPFDLRLHQRGEDRRIVDPGEGGRSEAYYERARENVERLRKTYGVEMATTLATDVDAWNAHQAAQHVQRAHDAGTFRRFHEAVFDALWVHERDIGDAGVLAEIARDVGIDPEVIREALRDASLKEDLTEAFRGAHREGITGVPTFLFNDLRLAGAIPPEDIRKLVQNG